MFQFTVQLIDPSSELSATTATLIRQNLEAAFTYIGRYFDGLGSLDLDATFSHAGTSYIASAAPDVTIPIGRAPDGGTLVRVGTVYEMLTGVDPNGAARDLHVDFNLDQLSSLWLDPTPSDRSALPPAGLVDFQDVVVHEIVHGLGFIGNRQLDGSFPDADRTSFDAHTVIDATGAHYDSLAVEAVIGHPVALDTTHGDGSRWYHSADPSDLMFWQTSAGIRKGLSLFDLAVLHDQGLKSAAPGSGDDVWFGQEGGPGDVVDGGAGNDVLVALGSRNMLTGGPGNDLLIGGAGFTTAAYHEPRADYSMTRRADGTVTLVDLVGTDGTDTLRSIEAVQFTDRLIFTVTGSDATIARLYAAAFARAPDAGGLAVQLDALHGGWTSEGLAQNFLGSAEFAARYGSNPTNAQYVDALYQNALGRMPDAGGFAVQLAALEHGLPRADLLLNFADSPENQARVAADWLLA